MHIQSLTRTARAAARRVVLTGALVALSSLAAACRSTEGPRSGAPPTVICGHTISTSAAGPVVTDATQPGQITVTNETVGGIFLLLTRSCTAGAVVSTTPPTAMQTAAAAPARDGRAAAVVLRPVSTSADVVIRRDDGTVTIVHIRLLP